MSVVVVGGGAIGLSIAWRAALAGMDTTVVDPAPGRGASWAAAGMLAPVTEAHYGETALLAFNLMSAQRWPSFAEELAEASGRDPGYRQCGTVMVARDTDDQLALADLLAFRQRLGLQVQRLTGREVRTLEPGLSPRIRGGLLVEGDHQVDNRALVEALLAGCTNSGVQVRRATARDVVIAGDRVSGVRLDDGSVLLASAVVLACGAASAALAGVPAGLVPVRPVKGQLLHLRGHLAGEPLARRVIRGLDVYVVPRADGRLVVGATVEEMGTDLRVTGGGVFELLRDAYELLPGIAELELVETTAGLRPGTPDNAPLLGRTTLDGLVVATGHYRNGILLAPSTSDLVVEVLAGKEPPELAAFDPRRFCEDTR